MSEKTKVVTGEERVSLFVCCCFFVKNCQFLTKIDQFIMPFLIIAKGVQLKVWI